MIRAPERDLLAGEAVGVAAAVPALVAVRGPGDVRRRGTRSGARICSPITVCCSIAARSSSVRRPGLLRIALRDRELADVVEGGAEAQRPQRRPASRPSARPTASAFVGDRARVARRVGVLGLERGRQRLGGAQVRLLDARVQTRRSAAPRSPGRRPCAPASASSSSNAFARGRPRGRSRPTAGRRPTAARTARTRTVRGLPGGAVVGLGADVPHHHHVALAQRAPDQPESGGLAPAEPPSGARPASPRTAARTRPRRSR